MLCTLLISSVVDSVVDPKTFNLDPDPGFWPNLDPDPDPGLYCTINFKRKNLK